MKFTDGLTESIWPITAEIPEFKKLKSSARADVCIIGAGIAGSSSAYQLQRRGKKVLVVSETQIGDSQTGRTSAHLASEIDDRLFEMIRQHGEEATKLAYQSHAAAIDSIEEISKREKIECDFARVDGYLFLGQDDDPNILDKEFEAARKINFPGVDRLPRAPIDRFDTGACLKFPRQAIFHPLKYIAGLAKCIVRDGGQIYCGNRAIDVHGTDENNGTPCTVKTGDGHTITCDAVVIATNTPSPLQNWAGIYTKNIPFRSYVVVGKVPRGSVTNALYWDTLDPYHYVRIDSTTDVDHDLLIVGGEDHKVGQPEKSAAAFLNLEQWARQRFPMVINFPYRWSGQVQEPVDGFAYIGPVPVNEKNVYCATGDSGMGLTHGAAAGLMLADMITGKKSPWEEIYDPGRKPTANVTEFIKENANVTAKYADYITPGDVSSEEEISPGYGAVIRDGLKKIAVYRDDAGKFHRCSAICTHLACIVHWNGTEKTWDCPCHGSRFDTKGKVLIGPATDDLPEISQ